MTSRTSLVAAVEAKTTLAKILGVTTPPDELQLIDTLPDAIDLTFTPQQLVEIARANRLDLKAAGAVTQAAEREWPMSAPVSTHGRAWGEHGACRPTFAWRPQLVGGDRLRLRKAGRAHSSLFAAA